MQKKIDKDNVQKLVNEALWDRDKKKVKELLLKAMQIYLEDGVDFTKGNLDEIGDSFVWYAIFDNLKLKNKRLEYCFGTLGSKIEFMPEKRAKEVVKRLILYLQNKNYEGKAQMARG